MERVRKLESRKSNDSPDTDDSVKTKQEFLESHSLILATILQRPADMNCLRGRVKEENSRWTRQSPGDEENFDTPA
jgi:hypothetical protein